MTSADERGDGRAKPRRTEIRSTRVDHINFVRAGARDE